MPKALSLGNGSMLVNLDGLGSVRDLYFPYVGLENQVGGNLAHRLGVFVDNKFSWFDDGTWQIDVRLEKNVLVGQTTAKNVALGLTLVFSDAVVTEKNVFIRRVSVVNEKFEERTIKLFFHHQFELYESETAHTAYYDPINKVIIHYRNQRAILINALIDGHGFDDFSTGIFHTEGKEGTHKDAEDGLLSKNPIEHGLADSVIGVSSTYKGGEEKIIYYWLAVGMSIGEAQTINSFVLEKGVSHLLKTSRDFWHAWISRREFSFYGLDERTIDLFNHSLLSLRAHVGDNGALIASSDANLLHKGRDTYAYVWPRDAALSTIAISKAGDFNVARRFFEFCAKVISDDGYFMHKYSPDGSLGSSWHPWLRNGKVQLPIQEDETALVVYSLWQYYHLSKDLEFIEEIYTDVIKKAADFLVTYRDEVTGLPKPSYDLWEEKYGVSTFTACAVYGALIAAARFAHTLGKAKTEKRYLDAAAQVASGVLKYLYNEEGGYFYKMVNFDDDGKPIYDHTIDASSVYAVYTFGLLPASDSRVERAVKITDEALRCKTAVGGVARYQNDNYYLSKEGVPGNPWFITTLWHAQYQIALAKTEADLKPVVETLNWVVSHATPSDILSEQLDPYTGEPLSVAPLVWSHGEFVTTVLMYLDKLEAMGICKACNPVD